MIIEIQGKNNVDCKVLKNIINIAIEKVNAKSIVQPIQVNINEDIDSDKLLLIINGKIRGEEKLLSVNEIIDMLLIENYKVS